MANGRTVVTRIEAGEYAVAAADGEQFIVEKIDEAPGWRVFRIVDGEKGWEHDFDTKREALAWID